MGMEELLELGLTKNEAKVYEALLKFGKIGAGEASKNSGVSYSRIYDVLGSLINKGFVIVVPEKTKKFAPTSPEQFMKSIEERENSLNKLKGKVVELKKMYDIKDKNPVSLGVGQKAFYKILHEMKDTEKIEYSVKWSSEYRDEWERSHKEKRRKKVEIKSLVRYDENTKKTVEKWAKIHKDMKKIDNEGIAMDIRDNEVMIGLIKSNVTLLIRDKPFAKIMKRMFLDSYNVAEKIK